MQEAYPLRVCSDCGRFLWYWKEEFLCWDCWRKFTLEETLPHPHPEGICRFVRKDSEAGSYFICVNCTKTIFLPTEELKAYEDRMNTFFSPEHIEKERQERKAWEEKWERRLAEKEAQAPVFDIKSLFKGIKPGDTVVFVSGE